MEFYTIGVYNSSEKDYFKKLTDYQIDTFCDIRQRRGVRGAQYSFVNSKKLQLKLTDLNIRYNHIINLAPTAEIRTLQKNADTLFGELKRNRNKLGEVFSLNYKQSILNRFDFNSFIEELKNNGAKKIIFFCVEEKPEACHRSLVTDKLKDIGYKVTHI